MKTAFALASLVMLSCTPGGTVNPNVLTPGVDFAACVLAHAASDIAKHLTPLQTTEEILMACGGDLVLIANTLDADVKAHDVAGTAAAPSFAAIASTARARHAEAGH